MSYDEAMQIRVLPRAISLLTRVQTLNLYGTNLVELPAEVRLALLCVAFLYQRCTESSHCVWMCVY